MSPLPVSRAIGYLGIGTIILYGTIMQPTPDSVTWQLIVWSLVAAIPFLVSLRNANRCRTYIFFVISLIFVGIVSAAVAGNDLVQLVRDLIGYLFWIFGPLLVFLLTSRPRTGEPILSLEHVRFLLALAGAALSVRYLLQQGESLSVALAADLRVNLEYLSSEPLVTYAFLYAAAKTFSTPRVISSFGYGLLFLLSSLGLIAANFRGPLLLGAAVFVSSGLAFSIGKFRSSPLRVITIAAGAIIGVYLLQAELNQIWVKVATKFKEVGSNSKLEEFVDVFSSGTGFWQILMGNGLGGRRYIVGAGTITGYTHNILSYAYLKTGYIGVFFTLATLVTAITGIAFRRRWRWHYAPEVITILYIGLFQAAYKHFGYGLLLGVCCVVTTQIRAQLRENRIKADSVQHAIQSGAENFR
jgi:hypothetical protein